MQRPDRYRTRAPLGLLLGAAIALCACDERPTGPDCSKGTTREPDHLERLLQRLSSDPSARALVIATHGRYVACFGEGVEPGVDPQHRLRLDRSQSDERAAAKLGHLLMHVSRGLPFEEDDPRPCAVRLAQARTREQAAHALESSLLKSYGLPPLDDGDLERVMAGYRSRCGESSK